MKQKIFFLIALIVSLTSIAQTRQIIGHVTAFDSIPLKNIQVEATGTKKSVITDVNGKFTIDCNTKDVIRFTAKPFSSKKVKIDKNSSDTLDVVMEFITKEGNVELAVKSDHVKEHHVSAIEVYLEKHAPDFCTYPDIFAIVEEYCTGIDIIDDGGETKVVLRSSAASTGTRQTVLYVVDGVETRSVSTLPTCSVKSVKLLKEGETTAFGARGGAGVLLITTKGGAR